MNILFVTPTPPDRPDRDGMTQIAYFLCRELSTRHSVTVWTLADPKDGDVNIDAVAVRIFPRWITSLLNFYRHPSALPYFHARNESVELHQALRSLAPEQFDLVVLHTPFVAHYLPDVRQFPVAINVVDALSDWFTSTASTTGNLLKRWHLRREARLAKNMEEDIFPHAAGLSVVSEADAETIKLAAPHTPVAVFPIGIDEHTFYPPATTRNPETVVFSGIMDYPPNVQAAEFMVHQVWSLVHKNNPTAKLRLVGKNPTHAVQELGRYPGVTVTGFVPSVADELRRATIVVSPLPYGTGFKIKVNEALACGAPLIVSAASLPGTGVQPGRDCLIAKTPAEWAEKINYLLHNPVICQHLSSSALTLMAARRWPAIAAQYSDWYNSLVHETVS